MQTPILTFKSLHSLAPTYLSRLISCYPLSHILCSNQTKLVVVSSVWHLSLLCLCTGLFTTSLPPCLECTLPLVEYVSSFKVQVPEKAFHLLIHVHTVELNDLIHLPHFPLHTVQVAVVYPWAAVTLAQWCCGPSLRKWRNGPDVYGNQDHVFMEKHSFWDTSGFSNEPKDNSSHGIFCRERPSRQEPRPAHFSLTQ